MKAVITPTGISDGAINVRLAVSARINKMAPVIAERGSSKR